MKYFARRAVFFAVCALFVIATGILGVVHAETVSNLQYYVLHNQINNGDMNTDADDNGLTDGWSTSALSGYYEIINGIQYIYGGSVSNSYFYQAPDSKEVYHFYYVSFDWTFVDNSGNATFDVYNYATGSMHTIATDSDSGFYSTVFTPATVAGTEYIFYLTGSLATIDDYIAIDNVIIVDLTTSFGSIYDEYTASYYEQYFFPDGYFDSYSSFYAMNYRAGVPSSNLGTNLDMFDYTTSIVATYGTNMNVQFAMKFNDVEYSGITLYGYILANEWLYGTDHNVEACYNGVCESYGWRVSDYSSYVLELDITDAQEDMLRRILFDRDINTDNYIKIPYVPNHFTYNNLYSIISSQFALRVNVESMMISGYMTTYEGTFHMMYVNFIDENGYIMDPGIYPFASVTSALTISDPATYAITDFGSAYTNVSVVETQFQWITDTDDENIEYLTLYELGFFSSDDVFIPSYVDGGDIGLLWDQKVCEWYQIGCQLSNWGNETVSAIYYKLRIDDMIDAVSDIFDSANAIYSVLPTALQTIVIIVAGVMGVGVIFIIVNSVKGD